MSTYLLMETAGRERPHRGPEGDPTHHLNTAGTIARRHRLSGAEGMGHAYRSRCSNTDTTPLGLFATKARASNRPLYGDLRRLQRDVLPTGATSREEVGILLSLDWIERVDRDWPRYLAMTVREFVLSTSDPPGVVSEEAAVWLAAALADTRPKTAAIVLRSIMGEAHRLDGALVAFVREGAKPRYEESCPAEHRTGFHFQESATSKTT